MTNPNDLGGISDNTENISKQLSGVETAIKKLTDGFTNFISTLSKGGDSIKNLSSIFGDMDENIDSSIEKLKSFKEIASKTFGKIDTAEFEKSLKTVDATIIALPFGIDKITAANRESSGSFKAMAGAVNALGMDSLKKLINSISETNEAMKNWKETQQIAREAVVVSGESLGNQKGIISDYGNSIRRMSAETGFSVDNLNSFNKVVSRVMPDSLRSINRDLLGIGKGFGDLIQPSVVSMTAFKAFGITAESAAQKTLDAFLNFNQTSLKTAENLGIMSRAASDSGVDLQTAQEQITRASTPLAIFGRQTSESTNVWKTFMTSLKEGGVPISQAGDIINSVTQSIAGMSVENRAFIGMMSGITRGASALGGALKMEFMMRQEGGLQKNFEALTSTLGKFTGGKIITLEQAANNPQLETQFQVQRDMLGKLTGITTREQQNRILEVMQKVQEGGMSSIDANNALKDIYAKGKDLQQESLTVAEKSNQVLRMILASILKPDENLEAIDKAFNSLGVINEYMEGGETKTKKTPILDALRQNYNIDDKKDKFEEEKRKIFSGKTENVGKLIMPPDKPILKVSPGKEIFSDLAKTNNNIHDELRSLNDTTKNKLQQLIDITGKSVPQRGTDDKLQQLISGPKPKTAEVENIIPQGSQSTLLIKFDGLPDKAIERLKKLIKSDFDKNLLGIGD